MSKFLVACGFVAVIAAVILAAGQDIIITECEDHECRTGCKAVGKRPADKCNSEHFKKQSFEAICAPAKSGAMMIYGGIFSKNASHPCSDFNVRVLGPRMLGECFVNHEGQHMKITGPSGSNVTLHVHCDDKCATCKHVLSVKEKACNSLPHLNWDFGYGAPEAAKPEIKVNHYKDADCKDLADTEVMFQNSCYGHGGGAGGRGGSHYMTCSN